jgi:tetratricopeptide (TPR) repeat protein
MEDDVARIRQQWERIKYQTPIKAQEDAYEKLAKESAQVMQQYPKQAEPAIWHGIVEASHAGAKGGLGALSLVKSARKSFETALELNPAALHGSAYTSLGSLYYQVPGWPIGFGDEKKALELLRQGLAINPEGIDPNFFLGDYLYRTGDYAGAEQALRKALQAPPREGRTLADEGRRREIAELMEKIRDKKR